MSSAGWRTPPFPAPTWRTVPFPAPMWRTPPFVLLGEDPKPTSANPRPTLAQDVKMIGGLRRALGRFTDRAMTPGGYDEPRAKQRIMTRQINEHLDGKPEPRGRPKGSTKKK